VSSLFFVIESSHGLGRQIGEHAPAAVNGEID
jgi:hypothetical protein